MRVMMRSRIKAMTLAFAALAVAVLMLAPAALAAPAPPGPGGPGCSDTPQGCDTSKDPLAAKGDCNGGKGVTIALPIFGKKNCIINDAGNGGAIVGYTQLILRLLAIAVGLIIVLMIIIAGIQYITSRGEPENVKNAKNRLVNAIIALVLFLMMYAIIGYLVPGGVLT
jgi:hypothetical protein